MIKQTITEGGTVIVCNAWSDKPAQGVIQGC